MQGSWNEIISFPVFVLSEYGFQTYYTAEDYAIYDNLHISSLVFIVHKVAYQVIWWMTILKL